MAAAELIRMSVSPRVWRSGVGTALLDAVVNGMSADGWSAVILWVLERNHRAIAFYSRCGPG